ncbi:methyl-accepting chemotaxis protein [Oceanobacillus arenosus]|uniref:Methyl-accepting chemotaxis protein n=1 Tax=Oceanobacillus arenosus TaxID=1229153 RepID=A0A3D8PJ24_9BACI|nr:methyl-accepting chemotaxis protein [Oceanobacillus arenosus]RDW16054.1 methyl-accepting chemotaxis protein [Oceanobacillus arenosus]
MNKLLNFKSIKSKILFGFMIVVALIFILGIYSFFAISSINKLTDDIVNKQVQMLIADEQLVTSISDRVSTARAFVLSGDEEFIDKFNQYTEDGISYEEKVRSIGGSERFDELIKKTVEWRANIGEKVFDEYKRGNVELAKQNLQELNQEADDLRAGYTELAQEKEMNVNEQGKSIIKSGSSTLIFVVIIAIASLLFSVIVALFTANSISKPIKNVMERMKLIASGDFSKEKLVTKARDEVGQLINATNDMNQNMRDLLNQINAVSETVSSQSEELTQTAGEVKTGTEQIATTMEELASGSETQANSASDLADIMGTFTNRIEKANENGELIQGNSSKVLEMTTNGSKLMNSSTEQMVKIDHIVKDAVEKMENLDKQSQEISKLVSVIKDVADQTNLLALNAAIEAARAGEHGKGFAVVADEVRKLAEQVALSVNDITGFVTIIQTESSVVANSLRDGYSEVEQGTVQIETTSETFNEISSAVTEMVQSIRLVSENLSEIMAGSQEMSSSIEEIASVSEESAAGVEQTAASAQQASSSMEEVTGSSEQLAKLAEELNELVRLFKL